MGIFDLVDPNSRGDYDEALQLAPDIVERETPFHLFLTAEDMNEFRATTKLATYWKYRKELFASRALRPLLDLSGCGALDDNDISVLRMGCVVPLPDDDKGRKVIRRSSLRLCIRISSNALLVLLASGYFRAKFHQTRPRIGHYTNSRQQSPIRLW